MFAIGPAFFKAASASYATLALTGSFASATVGTAYSSSIAISGGLEPYSLTGGTGIASGSLDSGFSLSITGAPGARFLTLSCASPATADTMTFTASVGSTDGQTATSAQSIGVASGDPYFSNVVSLLHFSGADGSTTFTDEKGVAWGYYGNAKISTAQSVSGGSSLLLDGTGDYIATGDRSGFDAIGDFTLDAYIRPAENAKLMFIATKRPSGAGNEAAYMLFMGATGKLQLVAYNTTAAVLVNLIGTTTISTNNWHHVEFDKSGTTWYLFLDGVLEASASEAGTYRASLGQALFMGRDTTNTTRDFNGYVGQFRVTSGVARHTSAFSPPPSPFPNA